MNAIIMAGGSGSRFWPLSRLSRPKQFLPLWGDETLLAQTLKRLDSFIARENIFIVTGKEYEEITRTHTPNLPLSNIILEPFGRNTAACIGLASIALQQEGKGQEVTIVCPADHLIPDVEVFRETILKARDAAGGGKLVVIGITPLEPSPHYGYIEKASPLQNYPGLYAVKKFVEKPSRERAQQMLETGDYYWNAGIFIWTPDTIMEAIREHMPSLHEGLEKLSKLFQSTASSKKGDRPGNGKRMHAIEEVYRNIPSIPIDIGILERSDRLAMIPSAMDWCDVGNWSSLRRIYKLDQDENLRMGKTIALGSRRCLLWSGGKLIAAVGLDGVAVVETDDSILVLSLERDQDMKELLELLEREGLGKYK